MGCTSSVVPISSFQQRRRTSPKGEDESGKQRDEDHHASNLSTITLDEHKHPRSNLYYKLINGIAVPEGMVHQWSTKLVVFLTNQLNSLNPNSVSPSYGGWGAPLMGPDLTWLDRPKPSQNSHKYKVLFIKLRRHA